MTIADQIAALYADDTNVDVFETQFGQQRVLKPAARQACHALKVDALVAAIQPHIGEPLNFQGVTYTIVLAERVDRDAMPFLHLVFQARNNTTGELSSSSGWIIGGKIVGKDHMIGNPPVLDSTGAEILIQSAQQWIARLVAWP